MLIMFAQNHSIFFSVIGLCLCSIFSNAVGECNRKSCPGPLYYYEEIGCTPIFENATSCCPTKYNCDIWKNISMNQCLVEGHVYELDEPLPRQFTQDPCLSCTCSGYRFNCAIPRCAGPTNLRPGCRYPSSDLDCCQIYEICEDSPVACKVAGKSYKIGETFNPESEPDKTCYCKEGYDGVNDERFCVLRKSSWCENVIFSIDSIRNNCAPIYKRNAMLYNDCSIGHICPENGIYTIEKRSNDGAGKPGTLESADSVEECRIGNVTMNIGDKFHSIRHWGNNVNCTCEVPPIPTCYEIENS